MILKLSLIAIICVFIIDISGIIQSLQSGLAKVLNVKPHQIHLPLVSCSFCITWWLSLLYIIIHGCFTLEYIAIILLFSALTPTLKQLWYTIESIIIKILNYIE